MWNLSSFWRFHILLRLFPFHFFLFPPKHKINLGHSIFVFNNFLCFIFYLKWSFFFLWNFPYKCLLHEQELISSVYGHCLFWGTIYLVMVTEIIQQIDFNKPKFSFWAMFWNSNYTEKKEYKMIGSEWRLTLALRELIYVLRWPWRAALNFHLNAPSLTTTDIPEPARWAQCGSQANETQRLTWL